MTHVGLMFLRARKRTLRWVVAEASAARVVEARTGDTGEILGVRAASKKQPRGRAGVAVRGGNGRRQALLERL
jgi:hypothetical protein